MIKKEFSFGIIPLQFLNEQWQVLLVQHQAGHWAFPKGHTEIGEDPKQTAERELFEETGLQVKRYLDEQIHCETYFFKHQSLLIKKEVNYFSALVEGQIKIQEAEIRDWKWLSLPAALHLLNFRESKKILRHVMQDLSIH